MKAGNQKQKNTTQKSSVSLTEHKYPPLRPFNRQVFSLLAASILTTLYLLPSLAGVKATDFIKFYGSAQYFLQGQSIHSPIAWDQYQEISAASQQKITRDYKHPNLNFPVMTLLFLLFSDFDFQTDNILWTVISLALCHTITVDSRSLRKVCCLKRECHIENYWMYNNQVLYVKWDWMPR